MNLIAAAIGIAVGVASCVLAAQKRTTGGLIKYMLIGSLAFFGALRLIIYGH